MENHQRCKTALAAILLSVTVSAKAAAASDTTAATNVETERCDKLSEFHSSG